MVLAADNVRAPVAHVFEGRDEVVGRTPVRADEHDVFELLIRVLDPTENQVVPGGRALVGHAEADRALVLVGLLLRNEPVPHLLRLGHPVELEGHIAVRVEAEPTQRLLDLVGRRLDFPARVGVLDTQQELAAFVTGEEPVEERRVDAADVQEAGRTRRKADSDGHASSVLRCPQALASPACNSGPTCRPPAASTPRSTGSRRSTGIVSRSSPRARAPGGRRITTPPTSSASRHGAPRPGSAESSAMPST